MVNSYSKIKREEFFKGSRLAKSTRQISKLVDLKVTKVTSFPSADAQMSSEHLFRRRSVHIIAIRSILLCGCETWPMRGYQEVIFL